MEWLVARSLTLRSIGGHDVLLDTAHDLFDSIVESIGVKYGKFLIFLKKGKTVICRYSTCGQFINFLDIG